MLDGQVNAPGQLFAKVSDSPVATAWGRCFTVIVLSLYLDR